MAPFSDFQGLFSQCPATFSAQLHWYFYATCSTLFWGLFLVFGVSETPPPPPYIWIVPGNLCLCFHKMSYVRYSGIKFSFFYGNYIIGIPKHGDFWISVFQYIKIQKSPWFKHGDFLISVFQVFKYFNSFNFNLHVLKHGGFVRQNYSNFPISVFQHMEIQKSPCIETWRFKNFRVLYVYADFFKRPITWRNRNRWWKYFRVWIRGLGTTHLWKKQSSKISCYCPFKETVSRDFWPHVCVTK